VFTVEQRDALRDRLLRLVEVDHRIVAGAAVGSLAVDSGDRFSDLDLTFGIADPVRVDEVLDDWTRTLTNELDAVHLIDLVQRETTYRVFLLPDSLQFDLSMTPAAKFRPAGRVSSSCSARPRLRSRLPRPSRARRRTTCSAGASSMRSTRVPASLAGVCGRRSTT
jgi:hypothetical protein